ncbi:MAG: protein translocase subunit SecF [Treponema sp.]|jgi:preprotein translocase subunit SecF|nr:protein translocase subunit SecF [Treponema sp.]
MKSIIRFSMFFLPAAILSLILVVSGIAGYAFWGFNLGVDFQAGLIQELQFAPTAFSLTWSGQGNAAVSFDRGSLYIVISGAGVEGLTRQFPYGEYPTLGALTSALNRVEGLSASAGAPADTRSQWLLYSASGNPQLGSDPFVVHYLSPGSDPVPIQDIRDALSSLEETVQVQQIGQDTDRHFMIRMEESGSGAGVQADRIVGMLESRFGSGAVLVIRSDYVGSRFSKNLTDQAGILLGLTLLLILAYSSVRFRPQYAIGAVIAIMHDAFIMVAFVVWTRMEFNTTTIAAILTILGYSINDTIVIFDRIRETRRIYPDDPFESVLNRSLTETLSRTIITTLTTMLAVLFLFIFTTGSMRDFALTLLVGMISGVYSTIFIASGFVNLWDIQAKKRAKRQASVPARTPAARSVKAQ